MTAAKLFLKASIVAALLNAPAFAETVFQTGPFSVQEGAIPGTSANLVTASGIAFNFQATINQPANGSFTETGFLAKTAFIDANGAALSSQLNGLAPNGYGIYGLFSITGTASANGTGGVTYTYNSFNLNLFADLNQDTRLSTTSGATGGTGDDPPLISLTLNPANSGKMTFFSGLASGDFSALEDLTLSAAGINFFVGPNPFYAFESISGSVMTITGAALPGTAFVAQLSGSGIEKFANPTTNVPEPTTVALLGLGLLGVAASRRKAVKSKNA